MGSATPPRQPLPPPLSGALANALEHVVTNCAGAGLTGLGTDIQEIAPFAARPFAADPAFYMLTFSEGERAYCLACAQPAQHFAARFAAKEAVVKAFGTVCTLSPAAVEIERSPAGAPSVRLSAEASALVPDDLRVFVSVGHCEEWAYAVAVVVRSEPLAAGVPHTEASHG